MSPTVNTPAPVRPTDNDSILGVLATRVHHEQRNTTDPRTWITVGDGSVIWDSGTAYSPGDFVANLTPALVFLCIAGNTGHEPGASTDWATYWSIVGPPFQNGFTNVGGTRVPLRYRLMREYDPNANQQGVEIQGSVVTGTLGDTIFTLLQPNFAPDGTPAWTAFHLDFDLHLPACDDTGSFVPFTVLQSGDVAYGFV